MNSKAGRPVGIVGWDEEVRLDFTQSDAPVGETIMKLERLDGIPEETSFRWNATMRRYFG